MLYTWLIVLVTCTSLAHCVFVGRREGLLTLDGIFVIAQWAMATGTLVLLDPQNSADSLYAYVISLPPILYVAASAAAYFLRHPDSKSDGLKRQVFHYRPSRPIWLLVVLSAVITIAYYQAVGHNTLLLGIQGAITGKSADYTTLRLDSYSASHYLFPGYVNQFKNTILPALTLVGILYLFKARHRLRYAVSVLLVALSVYGVMGTGQRGAFILFCLTLVTFAYLFDRKSFPKRAALTGIIASPFLFGVTYMLGRSAATMARDSSPISKVGSLISQLLARLFHDNQYSGQMAFRFTYSQPVQNGREWFSAVLGVLPQNSGSPLAREVFKSIYGSDRGTSPPSIWGSVYYNFGWVGLIILPIVIGVAYQVVTSRSIRISPVNTLELVGMSGTFVVCGTWIVDGPMYLLNTGAVTFAILWWVGRHAAGRTAGTRRTFKLLGSSYEGELVRAASHGSSSTERVLVLTLDAYQYSTRAKKAAIEYSKTRQTTFLGFSGVGRTGRWAEPGEFLADVVRVIQVPVRRPWVAPNKRTQLRNLLVSYMPAIVRMTVAALRNPADVIHVAGTPLAILGVLHKVRYGSWLVVDINERPGAVAAEGSLMSVFSWFERAILRLVGRHADLATVVTGGDLAPVARLGFEKVRLVRNAPLSDWRANYTPPPRAPGGPLTLVVIGTIFEGRGYEMLLDAFGSARLKIEMQLRIYGGGRDDYVDALKERTRKLGIADSVSWVGRIGASEVSAAYLASDIGLVLYEATDPGNDGLSNKILECVATGRPVLAGDLPENRRFVEEHRVGWLTEVSVEGLERALTALPENGDLGSIAARCRELGDTWLNWESEFGQVLEEVAGREVGRLSVPPAKDRSRLVGRWLR